MFITTANGLHTIPQPLLDRMEIIRLSGYTEIEKLAICKRHLFEKNLKENGLQPHNIEITDAAYLELIRRYTREAGVRNLERCVSQLCRKVAVEIVEHGPEHKVVVDVPNIVTMLGQPPYRYGKPEDKNLVGTVTGLAWTEKGGELLVIETTIVPGKGRLQITGKLGDVMQESARAALTYVRSRADFIGLPKYFYDSVDIHVHVPEGAIPKDGPSAGITIATSLVSALTGIPVDKNVAMTGEITLRGNVLPIGGLKEKALAAHRGGIKRVILPKENENDIEEIPHIVRQELELIPVEHVDQVLFEALKTESVAEFYSILEQKKVRDELYFEDQDKKKGSSDEDSKKSSQDAVTTH
jgi:ATP-dependent Lon protease